MFLYLEVIYICRTRIIIFYITYVIVKKKGKKDLLLII